MNNYYLNIKLKTKQKYAYNLKYTVSIIIFDNKLNRPFNYKYEIGKVRKKKT